MRAVRSLSFAAVLFAGSMAAPAKAAPAAGVAAIPPAASGSPVTALVGATVHTVTGPAIPGATVLLEGGKIAALGADLVLPEGAERIDLSGLHLYPGFIVANSTLGLVEVSSVRGTMDANETGEVNPNARAQVALNPSSELIPVTRANGVLTAQTALTGGILTGTSVIWNLDGWTWEEMTLVPAAALFLRWPAMVPEESRWGGPPPPEEEVKKRREKQLKTLRDSFDAAKAYLKARRAMAEGGPRHETDVRWEAMIPALERKVPVFIMADEITQIDAALDFARDEELRVVIVGGRDAPLCAERLVEQEVPVVLSGATGMPRRSWEPYDAAFTAARRLHEAGVRFCISTPGFTANTRNLPYEAAMAAAFGLPPDEALRAITLYPAQILGLGDRLGSIEPGKDANLIATDGDPLEIRTRVLRAWIAGRPMEMTSRHTALYEKWRNRPRAEGGETRLRPAP